MWVRKTEQEIQEGLRNNLKSGLKGCLYFSLGVSIILGLCYKVGLGSDVQHSWQETLNYFIFGFIFLLILFSLATIIHHYFPGSKYIQNYKTILPAKGPDVICEKCGDAKFMDKERYCKCGGEYIESSKLKWVDDKIKRTGN